MSSLKRSFCIKVIQTLFLAKLIHKLNKIYLLVKNRQMPNEAEKMTGSYCSLVGICSVDSIC